MSDKDFRISERQRKAAFFLLGLGLLAVVFAFVRDPQRAWANILLNNVYFLFLSVSGLVFIAIHYLTSAGWWVGLRRIPESMTAFLPVGGLLMLLLFFGRHSLYEWTHVEAVAHDPILSGKAAYLNTTFFFIRMIVIVGIWGIFAFFLKKKSGEQDRTAGLSAHKSLYRLSALFLPVFAVTLTVASIDWLMSLEPHWFSTIFTFYTFSGLFINGITFITLAAILLKQQGYLEGILSEDHLHDLGKLVFAFSSFWAYIWVCQYLLIWYSNIPEETVYYHLRTDTDWGWLFLLNLAMNWAIPFLVLMPRSSKRNPEILKRVCILLLIGHWLDLYIMGFPRVVSIRSIGPLEVLIALGYAAGFFLITARALSRVPLVAKNDPYLSESVHHEALTVLRGLSLPAPPIEQMLKEIKEVGLPLS